MRIKVQANVLLCDEQIAIRALLKRFKSMAAIFFFCVLNLDETLVNYYEPKNKAESLKLKGPGPTMANMFMMKFSVCKMITTCIWDT